MPAVTGAAVLVRPYTGFLKSAMRQEICVDQTSPKLGVFSAREDLGSSPQPVNQRCWWSRRRAGGAGGALSSSGNEKGVAGVLWKGRDDEGPVADAACRLWLREAKGVSWAAGLGIGGCC